MDRKSIGFPLPTRNVPGSALVRISSGRRPEPNFSPNPLNRFSPPAHAERFGVCYAAYALKTAVAETLIRTAIPDDAGVFRVPYQDAQGLFVYELESQEPLRLVDFRDELLKRLGVNSADIQSPTDLRHAQAWSAAIHRHSTDIDGLEYMSRQLNGSRAVAVFCRAQQSRRLRVKSRKRLVQEPGLAGVLEALSIVLE